MNSIYLLATGCLIGTISIFILGFRLRRNQSKRNAEMATRVMHIIFIISIILPVCYIIWNIITGVYDYDKLLGIPSLPFPRILYVIGIILMIAGSILFIVSVFSILTKGKGLPGIGLAKELADNLLYNHMRNPMALGFFFIAVGFGLFTRSCFFTLWSLIVLIPIAIFGLKFFEEQELETRLGEPYREYKQRVPFLIPRFCAKSRVQS